MVGRGERKMLMEKTWALCSESRLQRLGSKIGVAGLIKLTQAGIGRMLGVSQQTISRYYNDTQREVAWSLWNNEDNALADIASLRKRARRVIRL